MKKFLCFVIAVTMVLAFSVTSFAATPSSWDVAKGNILKDIVSIIAGPVGTVAGVIDGATGGNGTKAFIAAAPYVTLPSAQFKPGATPGPTPTQIATVDAVVKAAPVIKAVVAPVVAITKVVSNIVKAIKK